MQNTPRLPDSRIGLTMIGSPFAWTNSRRSCAVRPTAEATGLMPLVARCRRIRHLSSSSSTVATDSPPRPSASLIRAAGSSPSSNSDTTAWNGYASCNARTSGSSRSMSP